MRGTVMETKREIIMRQIGAKIAYQRKIHGYSQEQLSQKLHLGKTVLSRVERGKYNQNISLNMLLDIAEGLGVPVSVFVSFTPGEQALWNGYGLRDTVVTEGDVMKFVRRLHGKNPDSPLFHDDK